MESSTDGQRLNVMLVEARGRAGAHLKAVVRQAERTAPGAFLTRLRGEASWIGVGRRGGILVAMDSGRVLDVDRAVVVTGSLAAKAIEDATLPPGAYALASDAPPEALQGPIARVAEAVIQGLGGPAEEPPRASVA